MGETYKSDNIAVLIDSFSTDGKSLYESFRLAGNDCPIAVIDDDGFLPDDVISVYGYFLGDFSKSEKVPGKPRYFNQIDIPDYWEITSNNTSGKIFNLNKELGHIFYTEPTNKRLIKVIDWLDEKGKARISEHYNKYGALYAKTIFNNKGQKVNRSYFDADGREVIVENFVTGSIILNDGNETRVFANKTDFVTFFAKRAGFEDKGICFNSLSTPFFVSQRLAANDKRDVLFWQEPAREDIPGNMQMIFDGLAKRTGKVIVQKRKSYDKLIDLGAPRHFVKHLGFIYPFEKENAKSNNVLILTNSDRIESLSKIVEAFPNLNFHVAAITEMSSKLLNFERYENVSLYPGAKPKVIDELYAKCDWYFDINYEGELLSAVRRAFLNNHLIFAFKETLHNSDFVAEENIFLKKAPERFIAAVKSTLNDDFVFETRLSVQRKQALSEQA